MADLILIDVPELGIRHYVPRALLYRVLYNLGLDILAAETFVVTIDGTDAPRRQVEQVLYIDMPKPIHDYAPIITKREKLQRMRRGWRPYQLRAIASAMSPVRIQIKTASDNIGCLNFHKCH